MAHADARHGTLRALREGNREQVISILRRRGRASRAEIARLSGLSRTTVSSLVADLQAAGLVDEITEEAERGGGRGRPGVLLALQPRAGLAIGIDFGHTHIRVAVADLSSRVLAEEHRAVDVDRSASDAFDVAAGLVAATLEAGGAEPGRVLGVGVGLPGPVDRGSGELGATVVLPSWSGVRPAEELNRRLGFQVTMDNDANVGALAEQTVGAGRGVRDLIYLKVASGIGAGLVLEGNLYRGVSGIAGEIGHVQSSPEGIMCRCGNRGCLETVAAGPALIQLLRASHGEGLVTGDLLRLAGEGDVGVRRVFADAGRAIGQAVAPLVNAINPARIVVGGELSGAGDPLLDGIRGSVERYALPAAVAALEVVPGMLGDRAEVLGAVALVAAAAGRPQVVAGAA